MSVSKGDRVWVYHDEDAWIVGEIKSISAKLVEGAILHHVKKRFAKRKIYTHVGPILVAVNPFERLPIYEDKDVRQAKSHAQPYPHIFVTAAVAYRQLAENSKSQSCLISGESGAGKTETTKKVLTYLASVAPGAAVEGQAGIEERILMSNPLLESMGNAKTLRNNNSSRFGCEMVNYLLEKSRVCKQAKQERNYHIFYNLCAADDALKKQLKITKPDDYAYLSTSGCTTVDGIDDVADFNEVCAAMATLGIDDELSMTMFKIISSNDSECATDPISEDTVISIADFLKVDASALKHDGWSRRSNCEVQHAAGSRCEGHTREIALQQHIFQYNSFEQLCINYANEKLQFHFNSVIFGQEQAMYEEEGISLDAIEFKDNGKCECSLGGGKDSSYLGKIEKTFGKGRSKENPHFTKSKLKPANFSVDHFAGSVEYVVEGWLDKNRDTMSQSLKETMQSSQVPKSNKTTLGGQFRTQLISLIANLNTTEPHFIGGVIESPLIRKAGFAYRSSHNHFAQTYALLGDARKELSSGAIKPFDACKKIIEKLKKDNVLPEKSMALGRNRMFLKNNGDRVLLDRLKRTYTEKYAVKIQAVFRGHLAYALQMKMVNLAVLLQSLYRGIVDRELVLKLGPIQTLRQAIRSKDSVVIGDAIAVCERDDSGLFSGDRGMTYRQEVQKAKKTMKVIEGREKFVAELSDALEMAEPEVVLRFLREASQHEVTAHPTVLKAQAWLKKAHNRLECMRKMVMFLQTCEHTSYNPTDLLDDAREAGVDVSFIEKVKRVYASNGPMLQTKYSLREAIENVDRVGIKRGMTEVTALQKHHPEFCIDEYAAGTQMLKMLAFEEELSGNAKKSDDLDTNDVGPRLTPAAIDLCEVICSTDNLSIARKAQQRLQLMTKSSGEMEALVRCFKYCKLFCTWKYPENVRKEAEESGGKLKMHRSTSLALGHSEQDVEDQILAHLDKNAEVPEYDFFSLRASEARKGSHLKRVLQPSLHAYEPSKAKSKEQVAQKSTLGETNAIIPKEIAEEIEQLQILEGKSKASPGAFFENDSSSNQTAGASGIFSFKKKFDLETTKSDLRRLKISEKTREGHELRRKSQNLAFKKDKVMSLIPPSVTRVYEPAATRPKAKTEFIALPASQEKKLMESRKAAERQKKAKQRAFAHLEKTTVQKFRV
eukprot:GSChrysophyteH1.ASY1.ANO1.2681.1 assembled CDS